MSTCGLYGTHAHRMYFLDSLSITMIRNRCMFLTTIKSNYIIAYW